MRPIGRYDSPFVRRVGVSLHLLGVPFEQLPLSVFYEAAEVRKFSPPGRVPARRLIPAEGKARRQDLRTVVTATGAADKAVAISCERRRPAARQSADWIDRCSVQIEAAPGELETGWSTATKKTQTEIATATMLAHVRRAEPAIVAAGRYPRLERMAANCERLPAFRACPLPG